MNTQVDVNLTIVQDVSNDASLVNPLPGCCSKVSCIWIERDFSIQEDSNKTNFSQGGEMSKFITASLAWIAKGAETDVGSVYRGE